MACDVLEDGLGFLSPFDTAGFDQAVHEFLNGEYYNCPASGNEIATRLAKLREQREEETYLTILKTFFTVIGKCRMDKNQAYGPAVLTQVERGRNNENADCWALSLQCLLRDNPPNKFQPKGRESVFSLLQKVTISSSPPRVLTPSIHPTDPLFRPQSITPCIAFFSLTL